MTTFAEKSPEAAIPIDNSQRAKDLWLQTGSMLGMLPNQQSSSGGSLDFDLAGDSGSIISTGDFNININVDVSGNGNREEVQRGVEAAVPALNSWAEEFANYQHERRRRSYD